MQTPSILNQINNAPSATPAPRQAVAADGPFNRMLTQQIAERRNASHAGSAGRINDAKRPSEAKNAKDAGKAGTAERDTPTTAPASGEASATSDSASPEKIRESDSVKTDSTIDANPANPVTAELLALMANNASLSSAKAMPPATSAAADEVLASRMDARAGLTSALAGAGLSSGAALKTLADQTAAGQSDLDASIQDDPGFAATMAALEQPADSRQSLQLASTKLQDTLPAIAAAGMLQVQQVGFDIAHAAVGQASDKLTPQVGTPAWDQALGQKVVWMVAGTQQSAALTLNPPDLGPLQVVLNVSNGQADAAFIASQPEVRQALEAALPKLREMLSEAGIQLGQATISAGLPNQQNKPGEQAQQHAPHADPAGKPTEASSRVSGSTRILGGQGLVDTFA